MSVMLRNPIKRITVHAGFHKTGTSTIQTLLTRIQDGDIAVDADYWYPETGRVTGWRYAHHELVRMLAERQVDTVNALKEEACNQARDHAIVSCEDFSYTRNIHLLRHLYTAFPDAKMTVVLFVRGYDRWIESMYGEDVKRGRTLEEPWEFVQRKMREHSFLRQIERIRDALPEADVKIHLFNSKSVIDDAMLALCGMKLPFPVNIWENGSLSVHMTMLLRELYRTPTLDPAKLLKYIDSAYKMEPLIRFERDFGYLSHEQRVSIFETYYNETMVISKEFLGIDQPFWSPDWGLRHYREDPSELIRRGILKLLETGFENKRGG